MWLGPTALLAGRFGIESIIRKPPDVVLTVRDAARAQVVERFVGSIEGVDLAVDPRLANALRRVIAAFEDAMLEIGILAGLLVGERGAKQLSRSGQRIPLFWCL